MNGLQTEDEILSDIKEGQHRSLFVPAASTYVRVRVTKSDHVFVDEQITQLTDSTQFCYLLARDKNHPVYGLCPSTYQAMLQAWGPS